MPDFEAAEDPEPLDAAAEVAATEADPFPSARLFLTESSWVAPEARLDMVGQRRRGEGERRERRCAVGH